MKLRVSLLMILCCVGLVAHGQVPDKWVYTGFDLMAYKGDLSSYKGYRAGFHLGLQFNKKHRLNGAINLGLGTVTGENRNFTADEQFTGEPNRFFKNNFFYANYDLHVNIIKNERWIVYVSQGVGFIRFTPKDEFGESLVDMPDTRAEGETYRNSAIMLPTKIGVAYFLPNQFGIGLQSGLFNTLTDYLDNISQLGDSGNDNILVHRLSFYVPIF